jgi:hypothetical protein
MSTSADKRAEQARSFVPTMALAKSLKFDKDMMHVSLMDGRILSVPLMWFPRLRKATAKQRKQYEIAGGGISLHWPKLDEDLSIAGLMAGVDTRSA